LRLTNDIRHLNSRAASKSLEDNANGANSNRYYFTWGLLMSLTIMAMTVVAAVVPWPLVKKISSLAVRPLPPVFGRKGNNGKRGVLICVRACFSRQQIVYFIILFAIPLSVVMGQSSQYFRYSSALLLDSSLSSFAFLIHMPPVCSYDNCGDLSGAAQDNCNGFKTVFVASFFYMFVLVRISCPAAFIF
jgi:hypothetical protein